MSYRGRIAPTPTGLLHRGHAATFWTAFQRARDARGKVVLRIEDLDPHRCKKEFTDAAIEDLRWLGIDWDEGPDVGGPHGPYVQSERREYFLSAWKRLRDSGLIYPCSKSRRDVAEAALAPHDDEPVFPAEWRVSSEEGLKWNEPRGINWRFRVPDGETISFHDTNLGVVRKVACRDFGDFLVWNRDDIPAYELAVVVDDIAMKITEVVRGADLLTSTARQILLYRAFEAIPPSFYHCPLILDEQGARLAKRNNTSSIHVLREAGRSPDELR